MSSQVTAGVMRLGQWNIDLVPGTPPSIFDYFDLFEHVVILPNRVQLELMSTGLTPSTSLTPTTTLTPIAAPVLAQSVYTGVIMHREEKGVDAVSISGCSLEGWLGDDQGLGDLIDPPLVFTQADLPTAARLVIPPALSPGVLSASITGYSGQHGYETPRAVLQALCSFFSDDPNFPNGCEYVVKPDGTVHCGDVSTLYGSTPTVVLTPEGSGNDPTWTSYGVTVDGFDIDAEDFTTEVVVVGTDDAGNAISLGAAGGIGTTTGGYKDLFGNDLRRGRTTSISGDDANASQVAASVLAREYRLHIEVSLEVDGWQPDGPASVGSSVYLYDPSRLLVDTSNQVFYRGRWINPEKVRVMEATWPVTRGMGVYHRRKDGTWADLTDYVDVGTGAAQLVVGDPPRVLIPEFQGALAPLP